MEKETSLLELSRYIVLNPVRAGMVDTPEGWAWSSYRAMIGREPAPNWLERRSVLAGFGATEYNAIQHYSAFVMEGIGKSSPWEQLKNQFYLGSEDFIENMEKKMPKKRDLREVLQARRRKPAASLETYAKNQGTRDAAIRAAYASGSYSQKEIGDYFNLHYSRISKIIQQGESANGKERGKTLVFPTISPIP